MKTEIETIIAGCFVALLTAVDRDAADRAVETLRALAADRRTPAYEAKFFDDLADSITEARTPTEWAVLVEQFATVH